MNQPHAHSHDHHHDAHEAHGPDSHAHAHAHAHSHAQASAPLSARLANDPAWSLLRLSALGRMALAGGLLVLLWAAVIAVMIRG